LHRRQSRVSKARERGVGRGQSKSRWVVEPDERQGRGRDADITTLAEGGVSKSGERDADRSRATRRGRGEVEAG
jgi:hypothetical protein